MGSKSGLRLKQFVRAALAEPQQPQAAEVAQPRGAAGALPRQAEQELGARGLLVSQPEAQRSRDAAPAQEELASQPELGVQMAQPVSQQQALREASAQPVAPPDVAGAGRWQPPSSG